MPNNDNLDTPPRDMHVKEWETLAASIAAQAAKRGLTDETFEQLMSDVS